LRNEKKREEKRGMRYEKRRGEEDRGRMRNEE
jgi:hypothetical protein